MLVCIIGNCLYLPFNIKALCHKKDEFPRGKGFFSTEFSILVLVTQIFKSTFIQLGIHEPGAETGEIRNDFLFANALLLFVIRFFSRVGYVTLYLL